MPRQAISLSLLKYTHKRFAPLTNEMGEQHLPLTELKMHHSVIFGCAVGDQISVFNVYFQSIRCAFKH